jgi:hypothetical protein
VGAPLLISLYGYWPSFHDAAVISVLIERVGPTVTIHFRLNDMGPSGNDVEADAILRWREVSDLHLQGIDDSNWIWDMRFEASEEGLSTELKRMDGISGTILAESVEVVEATTIPQETRW